jgi:hypothetical protein
MVDTGIYHSDVSPKQPYNVKFDPELIKALRTIKERDGISESEQIRRGIRLWLKSKGVTVEADRKRVSPRKRP